MLLFFATVILTFLKARRVSKTSCGSSAAFYRIAKDHALNEEPISRNITTDLEECIDLCIEEAKCKAMNTHYRDDGKMDCHLLKDDHMSKPKKMITKQGWNIYDTGSREISRKVSSFYTLNLNVKSYSDENVGSKGLSVPKISRLLCARLLHSIKVITRQMQYFVIGKLHVKILSWHRCRKQ